MKTTKPLSRKSQRLKRTSKSKRGSVGSSGKEATRVGRKAPSESDFAWAECAASKRGDCLGRLTLHHVIPKQRLRMEGVPSKDRNDPRNLITICFKHHQQLENRRFYLDTLPEGIEDFAREYGLEGWLERYTGLHRLTGRWEAV